MQTITHPDQLADVPRIADEDVDWEVIGQSIMSYIVDILPYLMVRRMTHGNDPVSEAITSMLVDLMTIFGKGMGMDFTPMFDGLAPKSDGE